MPVTLSAGAPARTVLPGLAASLVVLAAGAGAQVAAPYPGLETPPALQAGDAAAAAVPGAAVSADRTARSRGQPSAPTSAGGAGLDFRHLVATPHGQLNDLDGDGLLDGVSALEDGLAVWPGLGGGRFGPGVEQPAPGFLPGQRADLDLDGRLDVLYAGTFSGWDRAWPFLDAGDGSFAAQPEVILPVDVEAFWTLGDMDGDGRADLVTPLDIFGQADEVRVLLATGVGHFDDDRLVGLLPDTSMDPAGLALGDLDLDGDLDVVAGHALGIDVQPMGRVRAFVQRPGLSFSLEADLVSDWGPTSIDLQDLTGDGQLDALVRTRFSGLSRHEVLIGGGDGSLAAPAVVLDDLGASLQFVDVDADGRVDVLGRSHGDVVFPELYRARLDGSLAPPITVTHVARPTGWGDLDGDGVLDLFSPELPLLGRGDGRFATSLGAVLPVEARRQEQFTLADLDADGHLDVVASHGGPGISTQLLIAYGRGAGHFAEPLELPYDSNVRTTAVDDLDADGFLDLLVCHTLLPQARLWRGRPDGTLVSGPQIEFAAVAQCDVGIGHFNADGLPDLVAVTDIGVVVRRNLGDLAFSPAGIFPLAAPLPHNFDAAIEVVDVDGDGLDDLLVRQPEVYLYRCTGHAQFAAPVLVAPDASHLTVFDVDGDGHLDLASDRPFGLGDPGLRVALGDGLGGFVESSAWSVDDERGAAAVALADVDGDGIDDLLLGHFDSWSSRAGLALGGFETLPSWRFDLPAGARHLVVDDLDADGRPDVLAVSASYAYSVFSSAGQGLAAFLHGGGPWRDAGGGLAGAAGVPLLRGTGTLIAGEPAGFALRDAAPSSTTHVVVGLAGLGAPLKGGVLVPDPLLILSGAPTDALGDLDLSTPWPPGAPPGTELWLQVWVEDAAGPVGLAASHGVVGTVP